MQLRQLTSDEREWYDRVRAIAVSNMPYIPDIAYMFVPVMHDDLGTWACDDYGRIYLSRSGWAAEWTDDQCAWVFIHECLHVLHRHFSRLHGPDFPDHELSGIAADIEINDSIKRIGSLRAVDGSINSGTYHFPANKTSEEYYKRLSKPNTPVLPGAGICSGVASSTESASDDRSRPQGRAPEEITAAIESTAVRINDEEKSNPGSVPGGVLKAAEIILSPPRVDWIQYLMSRVSGAAKTIIAGLQDSSLRRPSRRLAGSTDDIVMPGRRAFSAHIGVVLDSSGSMSKSQTTKALNELFAIGRLPEIEMSFLFYDNAASELLDAKRTTPQEAAKKLIGGGGTDMGAAIDTVVAKMTAVKRKPHMVVVLTDGETPWQRVFTGPVIAGIFPRRGSTPQEVPNDITAIVIED